MWFDKKRAAVINSLLQRFSDSRCLLFGAFVGTVITSKACLLLDSHGEFVGCEKNAS